MIRFQPQFVEAILSGSKTQTRRRGPKRWRVGSVHQARTRNRKEPFAYLRILDVRQERLGDISEADARAEGFRSRDEFFAAWRGIYGSAPDMDMQVWVVTFRVERAGSAS